MNTYDQMKALSALNRRYHIKPTTKWSTFISTLRYKLTTGKISFKSYYIVYKLRHSSQSGNRTISLYKWTPHPVNGLVACLVWQYQKNPIMFTINPVKENK